MRGQKYSLQLREDDTSLNQADDHAQGVQSLRRRVRDLERLSDQRRSSLQQLEERHALFMQHFLGVAYMKGGEDESKLVFDGEIEELTGYPKEAFLANPRLWFEIVEPEDRALLAQEIENLQRYPDYVASNTYRICRRDGCIRWVHHIARRLVGQDGQALQQGVIYDVTYQLRCEEERLESVSRLQAIVNALPDLVLFMSKDGYYLDYHPGQDDHPWYEEAKSYLGRHVSEILPAGPAKQRQEDTRAALCSGSVQTSEFSLEHWQGDVSVRRHFEARVIPCGGDRVLVIVRDITDRIRMEAALRESEERYRLVSELISDYAYSGYVNDDGSMTPEWITEAFTRISGYSWEEYCNLQIGWMRIAHPDDVEQMREHHRILLSGRPHTWEHRIITKSGQTRWLRSFARPVWDGEAQRVVRILGASQDITAERLAEEEHLRLEEEVRYAQKLESLGILAGGIAHDFNNLLTAIVGNISLARLLTDSRSEPHALLAQAEQASLRTQGLTQQLLTFSKGGAPIRRATSIAELLQETTVFALRGSRSSYTFDIYTDLWAADVDSVQISQAISNLVINSDQAQPDGGVVSVRAENADLATGDEPPLPAGRYVKISVSDQGIGIPVEHLDRIFEPYFSTKQKGSGLGLATTYSIIKKHGGHITVTSQLGQGASFSIFLPAGEGEPAIAPTPRDEPLAGVGRVLVMDDEAEVCEVVTLMLCYLGYEVVAVASGKEALDEYQRALETGRRFDAAIMDLTIPGGMGGKETVEALLKIDPEARVIVSSGYSSDPIMAHFREYGFCDVIAKPYLMEELSAVLHRATGLS